MSLPAAGVVLQHKEADRQEDAIAPPLCSLLFRADSIAGGIRGDGAESLLTERRIALAAESSFALSLCGLFLFLPPEVRTFAVPSRSARGVRNTSLI